MTLDAYLRRTGKTVSELARESGVARQTLHRILEGHGCHSNAVHLLELATGGLVTSGDLTTLEDEEAS